MNKQILYIKRLSNQQYTFSNNNFQIIIAKINGWTEKYKDTKLSCENLKCV